MFILQQAVAPPGQGQNAQPLFQFEQQQIPQVPVPVQQAPHEPQVGDVFAPHQGQVVAGPGIAQQQRGNFLNFLRILLLNGAVNPDNLSITIPVGRQLNSPDGRTEPAADPNTGEQITANYLQNSIYRNDPETTRLIQLYRTQRSGLQGVISQEVQNITTDRESISNKVRAIVMLLRNIEENNGNLNLNQLSEEDRAFINRHLPAQEQSPQAIQRLISDFQALRTQTPNASGEEIVRRLVVNRRLINAQASYIRGLPQDANNPILIGRAERSQMIANALPRLNLPAVAPPEGTGGLSEDEITEGIMRTNQALAPFVNRMYANRVYARGGTYWNQYRVNRGINQSLSRLAANPPTGLAGPHVAVQKIAAEAEKRALASGASRQVARQAGEMAGNSCLARIRGGGMPAVPTPAAPSPVAATNGAAKSSRLTTPFRWAGSQLYTRVYDGTALQRIVNAFGTGGKIANFFGSAATRIRGITPAWLARTASWSGGALRGTGGALARVGGFALGRGVPLFGAITTIGDMVSDARNGRWGDFAITAGCVVGCVLLCSNPIGWAGIGAIALGGLVALGVKALVRNVDWGAVGRGISNVASSIGSGIASGARAVGRFFGRLFGG